MKKTLSILFTVLFLITLTLDAKTPASLDEEKLNTVLRNFELALTSDNNGVQFWSMFFISRLKSDDPSLDLTRFNRTLNRLIDRDDDELIRVNAKMTYLYLNEPELSKKVRVLDRENPLIFYAQLYLEKYNNKFGLEDVDSTEQIRNLLKQLEDLESQM
jgi:hypothetical protein